MPERTVILYHGDCPDGFGGAYAAWKKFGDAAEYRPLAYGKPIPDDLAGAHLYFVDFCYEKSVMDALAPTAASFTVLDHHEGTREVVESFENSVYDVNRSGATIAWGYFHPGIPVPALLRYVEDDDLFRFLLPDTRAVLCYLTIRPFSFEAWDALAASLEHPTESELLLASARIYAEYFLLLAQEAVEHAKHIRFEGYNCTFATAHPLKPMKSMVGNLLAKKFPPVALVVSAHPLGMGVSIRGDGSVDVAAIARKYGGNGHFSSAGFHIPLNAPPPWEMVAAEDLPEGQ